MVFLRESELFACTRISYSPVLTEPNSEEWIRWIRLRRAADSSCIAIVATAAPYILHMFISLTGVSKNKAQSHHCRMDQHDE